MFLSKFGRAQAYNPYAYGVSRDAIYPSHYTAGYGYTGYGEALDLPNPYLSARLGATGSIYRRDTVALDLAVQTAPEVHHPTPARTGYYKETPIRTVDYEPVTRIESVPIKKEIQVPVQRMETREVAETIKVPVSRMESRTELRTEMVPTTKVRDEEYKWIEQVPVTKMESRQVRTIEMVPVTRMEPKEVIKTESFPVTVYQPKEHSRIEQVPYTVMEPRDYTHEYQVPVTDMVDKVTTRLEHYPVTEMHTQEVIEHQQVEKTDYVAVEKISYKYEGMTDEIRGSTLGTRAGEARVLGTTHVTQGPIRRDYYGSSYLARPSYYSHPIGLSPYRSAFASRGIPPMDAPPKKDEAKDEAAEDLKKKVDE